MVPFPGSCGLYPTFQVSYPSSCLATATLHSLSKGVGIVGFNKKVMWHFRAQRVGICLHLGWSELGWFGWITWQGWKSHPPTVWALIMSWSRVCHILGRCLSAVSWDGRFIVKATCLAQLPLHGLALCVGLAACRRGILKLVSHADVCTCMLMDLWENYFWPNAEGGDSIPKGMRMRRYDPRYYSRELDCSLLVIHRAPRRICCAGLHGSCTWEERISNNDERKCHNDKRMRWLLVLHVTCSTCLILLVLEGWRILTMLGTEKKGLAGRLYR